MQDKKQIVEIMNQLRPVHWIQVELKNGLQKRGKFLAGDKEYLHLHEQRVMATGLPYEGKQGQVPQWIRSKVEISEVANIAKLPGVGGAGGSKASKRK